MTSIHGELSVAALDFDAIARWRAFYGSTLADDAGGPSEEALVEIRS